MFGGQKKQEEIKRLEKEAMSKQAKLDWYAKVFSGIADQQDETETYIDTLKSGQAGMDQQLTQVIDAVNHAADEAAGQAEKNREILEQAQNLSEGLEKSDNCREELTARLKLQNDEMLDIVEQNKHFTAPAKFLSQVTNELEGDLAKILGQLEELDALGKQMGVVSLNAAIEAGRMGESGAQFVAAAEDVRNMSGQYQQLTASFSGVVESIGGRLKETEEQVAHLNSLLKENNICMGKTTKEFTDTLYRMEHSDIQNFTPEAKKLLKQLKGAAEAEQRLDRQFTLANDAMEHAGESFIKQQEALDKLKKNLDRTREQIKNVKSNHPEG